jgi:hypothetical protein
MNSAVLRPGCFGIGADLDSRQRVPLRECQACKHVTECAALRQARAQEEAVALLKKLQRDEWR